MPQNAAKILDLQARTAAAEIERLEILLSAKLPSLELINQLDQSTWIAWQQVVMLEGELAKWKSNKIQNLAIKRNAIEPTR